MEVVNHGNPAQVEQVLAGTAVAGPAALPVTHVGEGVPNLGTLAPLCTPARGLLALRRPAAPVPSGGTPLAHLLGTLIVWPEMAPNTKTVVELNVCPGASSVEGKVDWFGEFGKCWVSKV